MEFNQNGCWKMKKKKVAYVVIILVSVGIFLLCPHSAKADSGWDGNYSFSSPSFGDSSSGSSSSSWDYHSNSHHYHSSSNKDSLFGAGVLFIIIRIFAIHFIRKNYKLNKKIKDPANISLNQEYVKMEEKIARVIPNFNLEEFKNIVFEKYKEIQIAWMNFDYDTLQRNCTNSLYHMYRSQLEVLKLKKQKNIMEHFRQITFRVVDIEQNHHAVSLKVRTTIWCYDYIVDEEGHVVRGDKNKKNIYDYEMTFIRSIQEAGYSKCPNCGASLERKNSVICSFCNSKIINNKNYDWVLSKKEMISQK